MNLLFGRTISLQFRLTVAVILSILLILGVDYVLATEIFAEMGIAQFVPPEKESSLIATCIMRL